MTLVDRSTKDKHLEIQQGVLKEISLHEESNPHVTYVFHGAFGDTNIIYSKFYEVIGYEGLNFIPSWWESCAVRNGTNKEGVFNNNHIYSVSLEYGKKLGTHFVPSARHTCTFVKDKGTSLSQVESDLDELMDKLALIQSDNSYGQ